MIKVLVGETAVPAIHRLEQVSSEEKVGSLAENLMEALREHPDVEKKVNSSVLLSSPVTSDLTARTVYPRLKPPRGVLANEDRHSRFSAVYQLNPNQSYPVMLLLQTNVINLTNQCGNSQQKSKQ